MASPVALLVHCRLLIFAAADFLAPDGLEYYSDSQYLAFYFLEAWDKQGVERPPSVQLQPSSAVSLGAAQSLEDLAVSQGICPAQALPTFRAMSFEISSLLGMRAEGLAAFQAMRVEVLAARVLTPAMWAGELTIL